MVPFLSRGHVIKNSHLNFVSSILERLDFCAVLGTNTRGLHITLAIPNSFFRENIETKSET